MTDNELLFLAGQAVPGKKYRIGWNPLENGEDALRLLCDLKMDVINSIDECEVSFWNDSYECFDGTLGGYETVYELVDQDRPKATMRAIVVAAAKKYELSKNQASA